MANTLPLYQVFETLKKNGFDLGIAEYYALLDAIHSGFRFEESKHHLDKTNLLFLCEMLWLKPNHSRYEFQTVFEENFQEIELPQFQEKSKDLADSTSENLPTKEKETPVQENTEPEESFSKNEEAPIEENENLQENFQPINEKPVEEEDNSTTSPKNQTLSQREEFRIKFDLSGVNDSSQSTQQEDKPTTFSKKYLFSDNYFDISARQMEQVCRSLPIFKTTHSIEEIDSQETVLNWAKKGFFEKVIYKKQETIYNNVVLLTDNKGSMQAFELLGDTLSTALKANFGENKAFREYFFYNVPQDYFYKDKIHIEYQKKSDFLKEFEKRKPLIIIFSDAGAARGGNSDGRFRATLRWVIQLKKVAHQVIWLNPMPEDRWENTTAKRIARFVPMFSLSSQSELQKAMNVLKGKTQWKQTI